MIRCYWHTVSGELRHVQEFDESKPLPEINEYNDAGQAYTFRITEHKPEEKKGARWWFDELELQAGEPAYKATTPVGDQIPMPKSKDYVRPGLVTP